MNKVPPFQLNDNTKLIQSFYSYWVCIEKGITAKWTFAEETLSRSKTHEGGWGQWVVKMAMVAVADTLCLEAEPHSGHCSVISPFRSVSKPHLGHVKTALFLRPQRLRSHSLGKTWPQTYLPVLFRHGRVISGVMVWWSGHRDLRKVAKSHRMQNSLISETFKDFK